jgi:hypothetical protein
LSRVFRQARQLCSRRYLYIEPLPVQVALLDNVVIKQCDTTNPFAHHGGRDHRNEPARPDAQHVTLRKARLVEAGDLFLAILGSGDGLAAKASRGS